MIIATTLIDHWANTVTVLAMAVTGVGYLVRDRGKA